MSGLASVASLCMRRGAFLRRRHGETRTKTRKKERKEANVLQLEGAVLLILAELLHGSLQWFYASLLFLQSAV